MCSFSACFVGHVGPVWRPHAGDRVVDTVISTHSNSKYFRLGEYISCFKMKKLKEMVFTWILYILGFSQILRMSGNRK